MTRRIKSKTTDEHRRRAREWAENMHREVNYATAKQYIRGNVSGQYGGIITEPQHKKSCN